MSLRPLAALLLVASLTGSCSAGRPRETVLVSRVWVDPLITIEGEAIVSRDWFRCDGACRIERPSQAFRAADGRVATVGATVMVWHLENLGESQAECGGDMIVRRTYIYRLVDSGPEETSRQTLVFDDGSAVQLFVDSYIEVVDICSEAVGRWEGVEGTFEGRSGTYRWTDDGLQNELVLTES